ncbi:hypothetical protein M6B38_160940 [Iris pallida]|uniref:Uncharacterized protein n=1 Tax=Iris pallida TaxID=29817 RepID=A0AAX6F087_IRIPA|nr:hypothetical protein M6B38_175830 [Iris pallida]KAJ6809820.1 hypothetical protein M6B38_160940 [Iris pallida]
METMRFSLSIRWRGSSHSNQEMEEKEGEKKETHIAARASRPVACCRGEQRNSEGGAPGLQFATVARDSRRMRATTGFDEEPAARAPSSKASATLETQRLQKT